MMKKKIFKSVAIATAMVMAVGMTGCGKKSVEYTLESGSGDSVAATGDRGGLAGKLSVPESCDESFDVKNSGLSSISLVADDIDVPEVEELKKVYFNDMTFDSETAQTMVESLFEKDKGIYCREDGVQTKDEIKENIEFYEKEMENSDESESAWYESQIEYYKKLMSTAVDTLPPLENYDDPYKSYTGERDGKQYCLSLMLYDDDSEGNGVYMNFYPTDEEEKKVTAQVEGATYSFLTTLDALNEDINEEDMVNECQISEAEATQEAMNLMETMGITGLVADKVAPAVREWMNEDDESLKIEENGYYVLLARDISGGRLYDQYIANSDNIQMNTDNGYVRDSVENLAVFVDDTGVVMIYGHLCADGNSVKSEDVSLMSWDDMLEKVNTEVGDYFEEYPTRYSKVELNKASLTYIISADDDGNKFFMPAWVFVEGVELADSDALDITQAVIVDAESGEVVDIIENAKKAGTWQSFD
jgi:hypothetical protein